MYGVCLNCLVNLSGILFEISGRGIAGIHIPNSTYSSSNGKEIILFLNKSSKSIQICHHYSSYSCSSSYSTLWGGIDGIYIYRILFQFYLFPKMLHSIYYFSVPPLPIPKNYQKEYSLILLFLSYKNCVSHVDGVQFSVPLSDRILLVILHPFPIFGLCLSLCLLITLRG